MDMLLLLTGVMPEGALIEILKESIKEWEADKTKESFCKIATTCVMVATKYRMNDEGGGIAGAEKVMRGFEESKRRSEMMKPPKN